MKAWAKAVIRCLIPVPALHAALCSLALGQDYLQGDALRQTYQLDGLGVVGREIAGEVSCGGTGDSRIPLRASPDGPAVAALEQRLNQYSCQLFLTEGGKSERLWRGWDLPEISSESVGLVYFEERDGFARVLKHTVSPGLWVRVADMPEGRLRTWAELLVERPRLYLGYDGHKLRSEPSETSTALVNLRDRQIRETDVHQLIPTGALVGDWGEFEVVEFAGEFYVSAQTSTELLTGKRWKGWLRLLNSDGLPGFWFFTRD